MKYIVAYVAGDLGDGITERWVPFATMEECEKHLERMGNVFDFATVTIAEIKTTHQL